MSLPVNVTSQHPDYPRRESSADRPHPPLESGKGKCISLLLPGPKSYTTRQESSPGSSVPYSYRCNYRNFRWDRCHTVHPTFLRSRGPLRPPNSSVTHSSRFSPWHSRTRFPHGSFFHGSLVFPDLFPSPCPSFTSPPVGSGSWTSQV